MAANKKPKYVAPPHVPYDPALCVDTLCKGGPLKHVRHIRPAPERFNVLDVGTYVMTDGVYRWHPNPDSPASRDQAQPSGEDG